MKFRDIKENTTWTVYRNVIVYNMDNMGKLPIPIYLKRSYAKLISFYPLGDRKERTYNSLNKSKKVAYLFKYLIKISRQEGLSKSQIDKLVKLKNEYDREYSNRMSDVEKKDKLKMYLISKDYDSVLDLHMKDNKLSDIFDKFGNYTKLIIDTLTDSKYPQIKENHKRWRKENEPFRGRRTGIHGRGSGIKLKRPSLMGLKDDMSFVSEDVSEWDDFINGEVRKRLEEILYKSDNKMEETDSSDTSKLHSDGIFRDRYRVGFTNQTGEIAHPGPNRNEPDGSD